MKGNEMGLPIRNLTTGETTRKMSERSLYPYLIENAKSDGWALYRIEDAGTNKKPFDIGGCSLDGRAVALEVKICDALEISLTEPPVKLLSSHQSAWLNKFAGSGGVALFAVFYSQMKEWAFWRMRYDGTFILTQLDSLENWTQKLK